MATPFIGQIITFGGNFAIRNYAFCNGQLLSIAQNTALFSILGTTYGGNGQTTFGLPNLQGRVGVHFGQGPGLSSYALGQVGGEESHTLINTEMPAHGHALNVTNAGGNSQTPVGTILATDAAGGTAGYSTAAANGIMAPAAVAPSGGNQPHNNLQPYLALNFLIALQGIFPSRN
jgi:microcystin-dependent protein